MYLDRRLGDTPRWFNEPPDDADMRVPDEVLKCVCFIGISNPVDGEPDDVADVWLGGTGFFVGHKSEFDPNITHIYFVTAKHVADQLVGKTFALRINRKDGRPPEWVRFKPDTRFYTNLNDPACDVAIIRSIPPRSELDVRVIPTTMFLNDDHVRKGIIGPGMRHSSRDCLRTTRELRKTCRLSEPATWLCFQQETRRYRLAWVRWMHI